MHLRRLDDLDLTSGLQAPILRGLLAVLTGVAPDTQFCFVGIKVPTTKTTSDRDKNKIIQWSALDRWAAKLSQETAICDWHFHVPMIGPIAAEPFALVPKSVELQDVYAELTRIVERETFDESDRLLALGAAGRRREEEAREGTAYAYALGVRIHAAAAAAA